MVLLNSKFNLIKIISFIFITIFMIAYMFYPKLKIESNLLSSILPSEVSKNTSIIPLLEKNSQIVNVIFNSEDEDLKSAFLEDNKDNIELINPDIESILNYYLKNPTNFISYDDRKLLKDKKYDELYNNAIDNLYSPLGFQAVSFEDDPYFLLNHFLLSKLKGGSSDILNIKVKSVEKLEKYVKDKPIYLTGTKIHSYESAKRTSFEINIIFILSCFLILFLTWFYFRNLALLLPIALSVSFGFLAGAFFTKTVFSEFHITTLLFALSLIGIGIDYSYHYFFNSDKDKLFYKNLTLSYLTTALSFLILYFSNIPLLKEISVFMISGLFGIFIFILLIYPCFDFLNNLETKEKFSYKPNKFIVLALILVSLLGFSRLNFNDNLSSFYIPNKKLMEAQKLYESKVNPDNLKMYFGIIKDNSKENNLQKQEIMGDYLDSKSIKYYSMASFVPSLKRQKENYNLVKALYNSNLDKFNSFLVRKIINNLKSKKFSGAEFNSTLDNFILDSNRTVTIIYSNQEPDRKYFDELISINSDVSKYLKEYRYILFKLLFIVYFISALFLLIFYKKRSLAMFLSVFLSSILALGLASGIFGELNIFSIISIFLALGFSIDYSIFRFSKDNSENTAIFASALTTSFSFLLLAFTSLKLISSMSVVLFFAITMTYIIIESIILIRR